MINTKSITRVAVPVVAGFLTACTATGGYHSPEYRLPSGSTVELTQTLKFPFRAARTYIQGGEALRWKHVNKYEPYCSFGLNRKRDGEPLAREIHPTKFTTGESKVGVQAALEQGNALHVASRTGFSAYGALAARSSSGEAPGPPWPYTYYTVIELHSDDEPQVDDLTCAFRGEPVDRNLTIDEIRQTLGGMVRITAVS